ncbi:hypothetical protein ACQY1Q_06025 [Tenacibaculum sp. TC6]|uniref:hypothetical protein n=1 Tax=Tenacibaculum sp. TC6 TaxID=3423223 RepID=UPI003D36F557
MNNREAINTLLYREIKSGSEYNALMPFSDCSSVNLASGDTKVAIDNMALWSHKYTHHTKALTDRFFTGLSLSKLCKELHSFLFHHLQYKIDDYTQKLKSPACSWSSRQKGLDCKSYSIFASTVLLNRGIIHYLRRVIINEGEGFSHVYVIVPKNQQTADLKSGYYVIDGTINTLEEQRIFKSDDVKMIPRKQGQLGFVQNGLSQGFSKLIMAGVDSFIEHLNSCIDSRFDKGVVSLRIRRDLQTVLQNKIALLDEAIEISNDTRIENLFNELLKEVDLGIEHLRSETAHSTYDDCALEVLMQSLTFAEQLKQYIDTYLNNFIKTQQRFKVSVTTKNAMTSERTYYFVVGQASNPILAEYRQITIKKEANKYGVDAVVPYGVSVDHWLLKNKNHFAKIYNTTIAKEYEKEVLPVVQHIKELRKKVHLDGETLYYYEKPFHRDLLSIFFKHDTNYASLIKEEQKNLAIANKKSLEEYEKKLTETLEEDKKAKKRKLLKKQIGYGVVALTALYLIFKKNK